MDGLVELASGGAAAPPDGGTAGLAAGLDIEDPPSGIEFLTTFGVADNQVSDQQLFTALWFNAILGAICFVAFCFLQRSAFPRHYRHRLVSPSVTVKPRALPTKGWSSLWQWLINAIVTPEKEILSSAGLDAVVMTWSLKIGISLFLPMAIVGCALLIPLHYTTFSSNTKLVQDAATRGSNGKLIRLTIASLPNGSEWFWLHFALVVLYNAYAMCILFWHFRRYVIIRQTYLTRGDDPNYWMALTHQADAKSISKKVRRMLMDLNLESEGRAQTAGPGGHAAATPGSEAGPLPMGFARESALRPISVMSSLRGLGVGISKFFTNTTSVTGSRAPSLTPPPSELAGNSLVAAPPPGAVAATQAWAASGGGAPLGGRSSSGGASSGGPSVTPSPAGSVLGVSPVALAARMRLLRSPVQQQQQQQPQAPLTVPPPSQEMAAAPAPFPYPPSAAPAFAAAGPLPPGAAASTPPSALHHHHGRVVHMRTITEENLDLLLRPGSSGGLELLTPPSPTPGQRGGAAGGADGAAPAGAAPRRRGKGLGSTAEGPDGGEDEGPDSGGASPRSMASPFASSNNLAGMIASAGVTAEASAAPGMGPGAAQGLPVSPGGAAAQLPGSVAPPHSQQSDGGASPPGPAGWPELQATPPHRASSGEQAGAADALAAGGERYQAEAAAAAAAASPEELRLVVRSPQRVSSIGASDRGELCMVPPDADAWPTGQGFAEAARRVAYHWWKALPEESLQKADSMSASDLDGFDGWKEQPLLAKPSVRFRKTINADNPAYKPFGPSRRASERPKVAVNAQHYAILVTDVTQWPYPELQREFEAAQTLTASRRMMRWVRRLPLLVSRPGKALFGLRAEGDSDIASIDSEVGPVPVGASRRSIDLSQAEARGGGGGGGGGVILGDSPRTTDDLEAAVETIENAKARLQLLTIASSDDSGVIERASRTLKRIAKAERHVSRLAEQRERTVALSREHSQMRLALTRAAMGTNTASSGGPGSSGGAGSGGGAPGSIVNAIARTSLGASATPSRGATSRSIKLTGAQIARAENAVAGAAIGAGGGLRDTVGGDGCRGGTGAGTPTGAARPLPSPAVTGGAAYMRSSSDAARAARRTADGDCALPLPQLSGTAAGPAWHTGSSAHDGMFTSSGGTSSACATSMGGGSLGRASSGGSGHTAHLPPRCSPPPHLRLAVPPDGGSPPRPSPRAVASARLHATRAAHAPARVGGCAIAREQLARHSAQELRSCPRSEASSEEQPGARTGMSTVVTPNELRRSYGAEPGLFSSTPQHHSQQHPQQHHPQQQYPQQQQHLHHRQPQQQHPQQQHSTYQQQPYPVPPPPPPAAGGHARTAPPRRSFTRAYLAAAIAATPSSAAAAAAAALRDEGSEDVALMPPDSGRSDEDGLAAAAAAQAGMHTPTERRTSLSSLPPIEPATSPVLGSAPPRGSLAARLRGILRSSSGSDRSPRASGGRRDNGSGRHSTSHVKAQQLLDKGRRATEEEDGGEIRAGLLPSGGDSSSGGSSGGDGGATARRRWALVRQALESGRLLRLPYDAENYSIVTSTFKRLFPRDFDAAIPVINHKEVDKLLMEWESAVARLERAEMTRQRTGRDPVKRFCCTHERVETIPLLQEEILELEARIEEARRRAFSTNFTPSWFVFFKSQAAAAMAASTQIYGEDAAKFQVHPAPGPEEVNWQHLWLNWRQRDLRSALTWPLLIAVVVFPITLFTSAVAQLQFVLCPPRKEADAGAAAAKISEALLWPWYCQGHSVVANFIRSLITGWLPALLLNSWLVLVLPRLVYLLVQSEGNSFSLSALERRIGVVFFYWDVFNVFLQGIVGSTFFQRVQQIIYHPENLPVILGAALPNSSNFFIQFISMRALFLVWLRMCVPHGGVWQNWAHFICCPPALCSFCNTDRDKSLTYGPRTPRYGFEMGHVLLIYLLALTFSVTAPLLLPFSVIWFLCAWVQWRHNLCYVYQRKYESGGLMWTYLFSRICICLVIMQLFTFCVLAFKGAYVQAFLIVAFMPALTAKFHRSCQRRFGRGVENVPLELASRAPRTRVPPMVYIPPPLHEKSWGWYPEWGKIWDGWGMPTGYALRF